MRRSVDTDTRRYRYSTRCIYGASLESVEGVWESWLVYSVGAGVTGLTVRRDRLVDRCLVAGIAVANRESVSPASAAAATDRRLHLGCTRCCSPLFSGFATVKRRGSVHQAGL